MFVPKLFTILKNYSKEQFLSDLVAGIVVGIVALPLAIAFGIASGVTPQQGLITAIIAGFLISAFGGSKVQIGGPTGAFVVIVYNIVTQYGIQGLIAATILAGFILIAMGLARLGAVIKFIPYPVVVGFTSGIGLIIFSSQAKDFLGLSIESLPVEFIAKWQVIFSSFSSVNGSAFAIALGTVLVIAFWPKAFRMLPGSLVALVATSLIVSVFHLPVETVGSRFGDLPHQLPMPHWPDFNWKLVETLMAPAFAIALLGAIESLLSAVVADGMIGGRHRSNMELVAQGVANVASGLFGGIPATGAIARTATNVKNGGRTPVAGIIHSLTLLVIVLFFGKWAKLIPLACLAGILVIVAYHMSEWRSVVSVLKGPRSDALVLVITFFLTVLFDLTLAIEIGMVLSAFLFMHHMSQITNIRVLVEGADGKTDLKKNAGFEIPKGVEIYEINGPLFFGASHKFEEAMRFVENKPAVRILRLRNVLTIDATGLNSLKSFHDKCRKSQIRLIVEGIHTQPLNALVKAEIFELIGESNIVGSMDEALERARQLMTA